MVYFLALNALSFLIFALLTISPLPHLFPSKRLPIRIFSVLAAILFFSFLVIDISTAASRSQPVRIFLVGKSFGLRRFEVFAPGSALKTSLLLCYSMNLLFSRRSFQRMARFPFPPPFANCKGFVLELKNCL